MTRFNDGPAQGKVLMLKRSPRLLRVVQRGATFDALDQIDDTPEIDETITVYVCIENGGTCHINRGSKGGSGFYALARYRLALIQPTDEEARTTAAWQAWCRANAKNPAL